MSDAGTPAPEPDWKRRRRLAEIFGDVLPETTADDREQPREARGSDQWLKDEVPPHHGNADGSGPVDKGRR